MIVPDVNLLLYAHIDAFAEHAATRRWWAGVMNGEEPIGLAEPAVFGFVRVATNRRAFSLPLSVEQAVSCVQGWFEAGPARLLPQTPESVALALSLLGQLGTAGNLTTDAQLAALAIHHQATLCSHDTDFARFSGLSWRDPLRTK